MTEAEKYYLYDCTIYTLQQNFPELLEQYSNQAALAQENIEKVVIPNIQKKIQELSNIPHLNKEEASNQYGSIIGMFSSKNKTSKKDLFSYIEQVLQELKDNLNISEEIKNEISNQISMGLFDVDSELSPDFDFNSTNNKYFRLKDQTRQISLYGIMALSYSRYFIAKLTEDPKFSELLNLLNSQDLRNTVSQICSNSAVLMPNQTDIFTKLKDAVNEALFGIDNQLDIANKQLSEAQINMEKLASMKQYPEKNIANCLEHNSDFLGVPIRQRPVEGYSNQNSNLSQLEPKILPQLTEETIIEALKHYDVNALFIKLEPTLKNGPRK